MIPAHIYNDAEIFRLERERLFSRAWVFVGHESEVPQAGDYVVRRVLEDSFIISCGENGQVRELFNMCLHRGMQVCRAEMGNASHFRCPYHGWSYRNDGRIVGLPFHKDAYGGEAGFRRKGQTLLPAPALDTYNGLIFLSLDPDAVPLKDYLGDFAFFLDYYTKQSASGPPRARTGGRSPWHVGAPPASSGLTEGVWGVRVEVVSWRWCRRSLSDGELRGAAALLVDGVLHSSKCRRLPITSSKRHSMKPRAVVVGVVRAPRHPMAATGRA